MTSRHICTPLVIAAALALLTTWTGCSDEEGSVCKPGATSTCTCAGGADGKKTCAASGAEWGDCNCSSGDGGLDAAMDGATEGGVLEGGAGEGGVLEGGSGEGGITEAGGDAAADFGAADASVALHPWTQEPTPGAQETLYDVWGTGGKNIYAVGQKGTILHYTGRKSQTQPWWTKVSSSTSSALHGVWGVNRFDIFAVGEKGTILWFNGSKWSPVTASFTKTFRGMHGSGSASIFAFGEFGNVAFNGRATSPNTWTAQKAGSQETFLGGWGGAKSFVVAGSNGTVLRYDGKTWQKMTTPTTEHLWDVWGSSASNIFAVGEKGMILRYDGKAWSKMATPITTQLFGIWGSGPSNIWAVGDSGEVLHFNGKFWTKKISGVKVNLRAVWGSGPNNVWAVGEQNTIIKYAPCACKVGTRCYQKGDVDDTGCKTCNPAKSTTALSAINGGCTIGGKCYGVGEHDSTWCNRCDPLKSTSAWTPVTGGCSISGACYGPGQFGPSACQVCTPAKSKTSWSGATGWCAIGGKCYAKGAKDTTGCQECNPTKSTTAWTPISGMCQISGTCYKNGTKDTTYACRSCNTAKNAKDWTVDAGKCLINGKCVANGTKDTTGCQECNATKNQTSWSAVKGKCFISGKCYSLGVGDGSGCRTCAPAKNDKAWTVAATKCYIGGKCVANGSFPSNPCQKCDVKKSQTAWTVVTNKCWIAGVCYNTGQTSPGGCDICDPSQSSTAWTKVGCTAYPLPKKTITFAVGSSTSNMTMYSVQSDGTGLTKLSGWGTMYTSTSSYLYGRARQYYTFTHLEPGYGNKFSYYPVILPHGKGQIRWFRDVTNNEVGAMHVKPNGSVTKLYDVSGSSTSYFHYYFAVSSSGTYVAGSSSTYKRLVLMRTDGKTFSNGKPSVEWTLNPAYSVYTNSIMVTDKAIYVKTRRTSGSPVRYDIWWAPISGAQAPQVVSLPVGGGNPEYIYDYMAMADDGSRVALVAGVNSSSEDVISVEGATGKATKITTQTANYNYPSTSYGYATGGPQLAVSTKGTWVAYSRYYTGNQHAMWVAKADGSGSAYEISDSVNFNAPSMIFYSFKWIDDDTLIFTAYGASSNFVDIFRFRASTQDVLNVTGFTDKTKPYNLGVGTYHRPYGMWLSPNGKYLYYLAYKQAGSGYIRDIRAINTSTWQVTDITTNAVVYPSSDAFATCHKGSKMFFSADPTITSYTQQQVFMYDMNTASKAVQLTNLNPVYSNYNYIYELTASADCKFINFRAGYSSYVNAYSVRTTTPPMVGKLTDYSQATGAGNVFDYMGYSQDGSQVVYFTGTSSNKYEMYVAPPAMGSCCKTKKIYSGPSTYNYWMFYGVN